MSSTEDAAFTTTYGCGNCGNEWTESHPSRTVVERSTGLDAVIVKSKDCDQMITADCGCCRTVTCPVCELRSDVEVGDREPIQDGDSDE